MRVRRSRVRRSGPNEARHGRELNCGEMMARRGASSRPLRAKLHPCVSDRTNLTPIVRTCAPTCDLRFARVVPLSAHASAQIRVCVASASLAQLVEQHAAATVRPRRRGGPGFKSRPGFFFLWPALKGEASAEGDT